jgi:ferritin
METTTEKTVMESKYVAEGYMAKHAVMSLQDITNKLIEEFPDEIEGANEYLDMAISAKEMSHNDLAMYLCEVAKDEFSHAKFIHHFLTRSGVSMSEDWKMAWSNLESRFRREFR